MAEYAYLVVYLPRGTSREARDAARRILTDHAEYGDWELSRLLLNADGSRKATLRRRILNSTHAGSSPAAPCAASPWKGRKGKPHTGVPRGQWPLPGSAAKAASGGLAVPATPGQRDGARADADGAERSNPQQEQVSAGGRQAAAGHRGGGQRGA